MGGFGDILLEVDAVEADDLAGFGDGFAAIRRITVIVEGDAAPSPTATLSQNLKISVEKSIPPAWLKLIDPLADPSRLALAKIITEQAQPPRAPVIDPLTGKPIPRAIIVNDPELQNLAREGRFATLLRSPLLTKALNDPKVQAFLKNFQH